MTWAQCRWWRIHSNAFARASDGFRVPCTCSDIISFFCTHSRSAKCWIPTCWLRSVGRFASAVIISAALSSYSLVDSSCKSPIWSRLSRRNLAIFAALTAVRNSASVELHHTVASNLARYAMVQLPIQNINAPMEHPHMHA
jgi:hypothetical protein